MDPCTEQPRWTASTRWRRRGAGSPRRAGVLSRSRKRCGPRTRAATPDSSTRRPEWARPWRPRCRRCCSAPRAGPTPRPRSRCCGSRRCARSPATPASRWHAPPARSRRTGRSTCAPATPRPAARARQGRRLPTALVTTPESLTLLLARADWRERFAHLAAVVVDEWHELMGTQARRADRARTRAAARPASGAAGLGALCDAREPRRRARLPRRPRAGAQAPSSCKGSTPRRSSSTACGRRRSSAFRGPATSASSCCREVIRAIERAKSTLVFTNVRSQTEIWYQALLEARPDWAGTIALHHGSLEREARDWVEDGLRNGRLRAVVCTSSLDLGVDFAPVDQVLQIGSPKGVARLLQRAGRSGHQPGARLARRRRADPGARARRSRRGARGRRRARDRGARCRSQRRSTCWSSTSSPARSAAASGRTSCGGGAAHARLCGAHRRRSGTGRSTSSCTAARASTPIPSTGAW